MMPIFLSSVLLISCSSNQTEFSGVKETPFSASSFICGFDASQADYFERKENIVWKDTDGKTEDFFRILKNHGITCVRLRIWNDPSKFSSDVNTGMCDLEQTIKSAKRIKDAGLSLMLDFHYSDTWADPGRQMVPDAWKDLSTSDEIATSISRYTTQVLDEIKNKAGIIPAYVQVGNEINSGMLLHVSSGNKNDNNEKTDFALAGKSYGSTENLIKYLDAGVSACHAFDAGIKTVIHLADGGADLSWFFESIKSVEYDVIGLSYYPWELNHGTVQGLKNNISSLKKKYSKEVIVAECSAHWCDEKDKPFQKNALSHLLDPSTGKVYADLEISSDGTFVKGSVQNQERIIRHIIEESEESGASGLFVWGGDLYGNYKWGMFDSEGRALASMKAFFNK